MPLVDNDYFWLPISSLLRSAIIRNFNKFNMHFEYFIDIIPFMDG